MTLSSISFWIGIVFLLDASCGMFWFNTFQRRFKKFNLRTIIILEIITGLLLISIDILHILTA